MSTASKDIGYDVIDAIYDALVGKVILATKTLNAAAAVNVGSGVTGIPSTAHGFAVGDTVTIAGTTNYNGTYIVLAKTANQFNILKTFVAETFSTSMTAKTNFPVYKFIPLTPAPIYVKIGEVTETEDGTKDDFVYNGSIPVIVFDNTQHLQGDKKKAQSIINKVRSVLKPSKGGVPTGFIVFKHDSKTEYIELDDQDKALVRIADIYSFLKE